MTTPDQILVDLLSGQSTSDALAERLHVPMLAIKAMCKRHEIDGLVVAKPIKDELIAWRITDAGRDVTDSIQHNFQPA